MDQWLENSIITPDMWNCSNKLYRTNNVLEGWNNKLHHLVKRNHPPVLQLIKHLKEEAENSDFLYKRKELNLEGKRRKTKYVKLDIRINKIIAAYTETKDVKKCLTSLAYVAKLE